MMLPAVLHSLPHNDTVSTCVTTRLPLWLWTMDPACARLDLLEMMLPVQSSPPLLVVLATRVRIPLLDWASSPTYESFCPIPTITPWWRGRPTMEGKTARGASSPANPALHMPDPLSTTKAATSSSHMSRPCRYEGVSEALRGAS